ncbi:hypothetical protein BH09BAC3_BH09BAC3_17190 [soil metagenome]
MKKSMMVVGLMIVSSIIFAQRHKADPGAMATKRSEKMKTELSLNDDQYGKVKGIYEKFDASQMLVRNDTSLTRGTFHKRIGKLKTDQQLQLKGVLTDAQWTKWTALNATKKEEKVKTHHGKGNRGGHGGRK